MRETRRYAVFPSNLDYAATFSHLREHMERCKYKEDVSACERIRHTVHLPDERSLETKDYGEFLEILRQTKPTGRVETHSHWDTGKSGDLGCIITISSTEVSVVIESSDLNLVAGTHDIIRQLFQASNPLKERSTSLARFNVKKSVFLAHRFDAEGKTTADVVEKFLRRLGYNVLTGEGYEAKEIPTKVLDRISTQDMFMCVVTKGDHHWILSEAAYAKGIGKYIILLCEKGIDFNPGILGRDYEHIVFPPGFIEKAFSDLLYALPG